MTDVKIKRHSGEQIPVMLEELADVYIEAHAGNDDESDEMFSRPSFITRTANQAEQPGFEVVTARADDVLTGFCFGYMFPPGKWWSDGPPLPSEVLDVSKIAVIELAVQPVFRRQGLGRKLLDELLAGRHEDY